jgi:hypothetical protein
MAYGGFQGFINRLTVSLTNKADPNIPTFSNDAVVGGCLIVLDTSGLYDFFNGWNFLSGMFNFLNFVPVNMTPPPPVHIKVFPGIYPDPSGKTSGKFGIKIEWDAPPLGLTTTRIFRSQISGGVYTPNSNPPVQLIGPQGHPEDGIITYWSHQISGGNPPDRYTYEYNDPTFNKGQPVVVEGNVITGNGSYIDYDVDTKTGNKKYYYVLQTGVIGASSAGIWGPQSKEIAVLARAQNCIAQNEYAFTTHQTSQGPFVETVISGVPSLGRWGSIQIKSVLPFMGPLTDLFTNFLTALSGSLKTNSSAFSDFLQGVAQKFKQQIAVLTALSGLINGVDNFFAKTPNISFLNIPPTSGGISNFINQINNAKLPAGGFSGPNGLTAGIVLIYGYDAVNAISTTGQDLQAASQGISKSFSLIQTFLASKS